MLPLFAQHGQFRGASGGVFAKRILLGAVAGALLGRIVAFYRDRMGMQAREVGRTEEKLAKVAAVSGEDPWS